MFGSRPTLVGRRAFLKGSSLILTALGAELVPKGVLANDAKEDDGVRFGLLTDLHYADKPAAGTRFYRETPRKLAEASGQFEKDRPSFLVELGDLIDAADTVAVEQTYLKTINKEFSAIAKNRHYVLGNHCVDMLTKEEFLGGVGQEKAEHSFDQKGIHFIVLDACFRSDGKPYGRKNSRWNDANIPTEQLDWLKSDLGATAKKVIVFVHQRLDVSNDYGIKNARAVRQILEASGKVLAVFQGHSHKNDYKEIAGIHYCTLVGMIEGSGIENNGYSMVQVQATGTIRVTGFRNQKSYDWALKG